MEKIGNQLIHKWMWCNTLECVVEVLTRGHFPTTAMVKLPDDRVVEVEIAALGEQ